MDDTLRRLERLAKAGDPAAAAMYQAMRDRLKHPPPKPTKKERKASRKAQNLQEAEKRRLQKRTSNIGIISGPDCQRGKKSFLQRILTPEELQKCKERTCWRCGKRRMFDRCLYCNRRP